METIQLDLAPLAAALSRRLHDAGVPMTPERPADFARALTLVRPLTRRRLYWTARGVFVSDRAHVEPFDAVFGSIFGDPAARTVRTPARADRAGAARRPAACRPRDRPRAARLRLTSRAPSAGDDDEDGAATDVPLALASDEEVLAGKRFDALEPHELAQLYRLMSRLQIATPPRRTRRHERGPPRPADRPAADPAREPAHRRRADPPRAPAPARRPRRLVMLCDISGSMEPYARAYLQFLTCAAGSGPHAEAFVFATRLTRLTRALAGRHPERAIQRAAAAAPDWSSGTRIGDALKKFNDRHGRRGMARGAVVVILSDGWERGDPMLVGREMERLARLAHRIVWVNPRVSASAFSVQAGGMVAALPHCDALVSGHSFAALGEVADAIGARPCEPPARRRLPAAGRRGRAMGQRHAGAGQLGRDAQRARPAPWQHDPGMGDR